MSNDQQNFEQTQLPMSNVIVNSVSVIKKASSTKDDHRTEMHSITDETPANDEVSPTKSKQELEIDVTDVLAICGAEQEKIIE